MRNRYRIMIVEDSPTQALQLQAELERQGWLAQCAGNADEAMAEIHRQPPDLLVVDYMLPGMRGDELCRQVRMNISMRHIPIVMLTSDEEEGMEVRGLDSGADDFLLKSTDTEYFVLRVRALLERTAKTSSLLRPIDSHFKRARILAVDDSPTYLMHLTALLEEEGYLIAHANNGPDALKRVDEDVFDCVLVDLVMPEMDGIEVCRRITSMRERLDSPIAVLMLTGHEDKDDLTRALEAGADDFVGKSSDVAVLKGRIRALLRRKFYQQENQRILEELNKKELEAAHARAEKEAAEARIAQERQRHAEEVAEQLQKTKAELERFNEELKQSNSELRQFAHVASHDLQEPLRSIISFCNLLQKKSADQLDAEASDYMERIVKGALRMKALVQDLLAYSRASQEHQNPYEPVDVQLALADALANLQGSLNDTQAAIHCEPLPVVWADRSQMVQLLQNVIGNALKYRAAATPEIRIGAEQHETTCEFYVSDNGIGIAPEYHERIFEIFKRLHNRTEYPGTGIGLSVCKRIVERHGGRIWVESAWGKGSTFRFTIPLHHHQENENVSTACLAAS
ncbi:MAG TPA: response regulator [Pirellulales bacterium]|nr:response regulator [Pirellulales bacterium]